MHTRMLCLLCVISTLESDDMEPAQLSRTAKIRQLASVDSEAAVAELTAFLHDIFDIEIIELRINHDQYSLNSLKVMCIMT